MKKDYQKPEVELITLVSQEHIAEIGDDLSQDGNTSLESGWDW